MGDDALTSRSEEPGATRQKAASSSASDSSFSGIGSSSVGRRTCMSRNLSKRDGGRGLGGGGRTVSGSDVGAVPPPAGLTRYWPPRRLRTSAGGGASTTLDNAAGHSAVLFAVVDGAVGEDGDLTGGGGCSLGGAGRSGDVLAGAGVERSFGDPTGLFVFAAAGVFGGGVIDSATSFSGVPIGVSGTGVLGLRAGKGGGGQAVFGGCVGGERTGGGGCTTARVSPLRRPLGTSGASSGLAGQLDVGLEAPELVGCGEEMRRPMEMLVLEEAASGDASAEVPALEELRCLWKRHASALCR